MKIEAYRFGEIEIDGKLFDYDVVSAGSEVKRWTRKESHNVLWGEVKGLLDFAPEVVDKIRDQGVKVIVERTGRAVEVYDKISKEKKVAAALHLTC